MTEEEKKHQKELWRQDRIRERHEEWEKIKKLGAGARLQYFWDYYKIIPVIIIIAAMGVWLVFNVIRGAGTNNLLYVCILNSTQLDPEGELLKEDYINYRGALGKMEQMVFDSSIYVNPDSNGTSQQDVATSMKIAAFVGSGSMDVFLAPPQVTGFEQKSGIYMALDDLLTADEIQRLREKGCLYYDTEPETESLSDIRGSGTASGSSISSGSGTALNTQPVDGGHIYAVRVDQAGVLGKYRIYDDTQVWFSIIGNAPHTEEAMRFLHFLLGEGGKQHE